MSEQTSEYCADCGWRTESHGHWRECTRPKEEVEEHNRAVAIEKERDALLLQIESLKQSVSMTLCVCEKLQKEKDDALRLVGRMKKGFEDILEASLCASTLPFLSRKINEVVAGIMEKPADEKRKDVIMCQSCGMAFKQTDGKTMCRECEFA